MKNEYRTSNEDSWNTAKENKGIARPFAILCDGKMVGFTMFAFDEQYEDPNDRFAAEWMLLDFGIRIMEAPE